MLIESNFESGSEVFSEPTAIQVVSVEVETLLQKYERVQFKLSVIADEVPTDDFDIDAMIARERGLFDEKQYVLTALSETSINSEHDAKMVFNVFKGEALSDGQSGHVAIGGRTFKSFQDLMSDRFC